MIKVDVEDYCQSCLDFESDVTKPEKFHYDHGEIIMGDTVVQCKYRKRCAGLVRYLTRQIKGETDA